jgi:hypothetical protein
MQQLTQLKTTQLGTSLEITRVGYGAWASWYAGCRLAAMRSARPAASLDS